MIFFSELKKVKDIELQAGKGVGSRAEEMENMK